MRDRDPRRPLRLGAIAEEAQQEAAARRSEAVRTSPTEVDATLKLADAINRLAAAIERHGRH